MKKAKFNKRLNLQKEKIVNLNHVKGGGDYLSTKPDCAESKCISCAPDCAATKYPNYTCVPECAD